MIEQTLVIGSTGFVGRSVTQLLHAEDWNVVGMRRWNSELEALDDDVPDLVADLYDRTELLHAMSGMNYVVYAAAPDPGLSGDAYRRRATTAIRNVLEVARDADVEQVVVTSTAATIGPPEDGDVAEESSYYLPGTAEDPYVEAAYAVEQECFREAADGQSIVVLNPTVVLGPGAELPSFRSLGDAAETDPVNWVDIGRVARAHLRALEHGRRGERYIVGGENATLGEFYATASAREEVDLRREWIRLGDSPYRNRYLITDGQWVDSSKAERDLGI